MSLCRVANKRNHGWHLGQIIYSVRKGWWQQERSSKFKRPDSWSGFTASEGSTGGFRSPGGEAYSHLIVLKTQWGELVQVCRSLKWLWSPPTLLNLLALSLPGEHGLISALLLLPLLLQQQQQQQVRPRCHCHRKYLQCKLWSLWLSGVCGWAWPRTSPLSCLSTFNCWTVTFMCYPICGGRKKESPNTVDTCKPPLFRHIIVVASIKMVNAARLWFKFG